MGNADSSQSSDVGAIAGLANPSSFHHQSPNVARLIQSDTSSKMEYEFPISDVSTTGSSHHHHGVTGPNNHSIPPPNTSRHGHSPSYHANAPTSTTPLNHSSHLIGNKEQKNRSKVPSNHPSNLCFSLTSCFGCRTSGSNSSSMNPLRDKVHAIRIVRASNDLTPAVFDSHYNIITLEQLRECDNNTSANPNSSNNDSSDPLPAQNSNPGANAQNGNGSVVNTASAAAASSSSSSAKKDTTHRLKKKKKKRSAAHTSRPTGSDDDDEDDDRAART